ncbi:MAG: ATP-binding protein [Deltaproteobacteria bacterium]|nr:ATP-binding protein [Deltaproteobacteria bacterium]
MRSQTLSGIVSGSVFYPIDVEVKVTHSHALKMSIVGLPDTAVKESRERILGAFGTLGIKLTGDIIVNLSPSDLKKEGTDLDLPIFSAILSSLGKPDLSVFKSSINQSIPLCFGELGLDGTVKKSGRIIQNVIGSILSGFDTFILPMDSRSALEDLPVSIKVWFVGHVTDLTKEPTYINIENTSRRQSADPPSLDELESISLRALKAILLGVTGHHSILLVGPPGQGKTHTAFVISRLLPPLNGRDILQGYLYFLLAGENPDGILEGKRPFRAPHHSITKPALVGGGVKGRPGEITLANNGILFLDELGEFNRSVLDALRVPMETKQIVVSRANYSHTLPANFLLICASNPCPCGYFGSRLRGCRCGISEIKKYLSKFSGPFIDRIDIQLFLDDSGISEDRFADEKKEIIHKIRQCQSIQKLQITKLGKLCGELESQKILDFSKKTRGFEYLKKKKLSMRSIIKALRLAWTLSFIKGKDYPEEAEAEEALEFRRLDRLFDI